MVGCSQEQRWGMKQREELRKELRAYRDMVYLDNLAEAEFINFSGDVVEAIEIDYLYFCARAEMDGRHNFARTLKEHNANAAAYHRALERLKIK